MIGVSSKAHHELRDRELFQVAIHSMSFYSATVITCRYITSPELTDSLDYEYDVEKAVELAVAKTVLDNPLLQVELYGDSTKNPGYVALKQLDLARHIEWTKPLSEDYDDVYNATLQVQMDKRFTNIASQPGWRISVLQNQAGNFLDIMFSWHHSFTDGMGAKIFHGQLLRNLCALDTVDKDSIPLKDHILTLPKTWDKESFPPKQEDLGRYKASLDYVAKILWHEVITPSTKDSAYLASWVPVSATPFATNFRRICLDDETLQRLVVASRENKTTLTGLFHGITLACLSSQLTENEARGFTSVTARNMRPSTPASAKWDPSKLISNIVSIVDHQFNRDVVAQIRKSDDAGVEKLIWSVSATVKGEIRKAVDLGLKNNNIGVMGVVGDWQDYHRSLVKSPGITRGSSPISVLSTDHRPRAVRRARAGK